MKTFLLRILFFAVLILAVSATVHAQSANGLIWDKYFFTGQMAVGKLNPDRSNPASYAAPCAWLEIGKDSTSKGVLLPRVLHLSAIANPVAGLAAYAYDSAAVCIYTGTAWRRVGGGGSVPTYNQVIAASPAVVVTAKPMEFNGRIIVKGNTFPTSTTGLSLGYLAGGTGGFVTSQDSGNYAPMGFYGNQYYWQTGGNTGMILDAANGLQIAATKNYTGPKSTALRYPIFDGAILKKIPLDSLTAWLGSGGGAAQINADWNATGSGVDVILNKPIVPKYEGNDAWTIGQRGAGAIGDYSFAGGESCIAEGEAAISLGEVSSASGEGAVAMGIGVNALSRGEVAFGQRNTLYNVQSPTGTNFADRAFSIGVGINSSARADAFAVWKDGRVFMAGLSTLAVAPAATGVTKIVYADEKGMLTHNASDSLAGSAVFIKSSNNFNMRSPNIGSNSDNFSNTSPMLPPTFGSYCNQSQNSNGFSFTNYTSSFDTNPNYLQLTNGGFTGHYNYVAFSGAEFNITTNSNVGGSSIVSDGNISLNAVAGSANGSFVLTANDASLTTDQLNLTSTGDMNLNSVSGHYTLAQIGSYASDAAADADANLPAGALYRINGSRAIYQKP